MQVLYKKQLASKLIIATIINFFFKAGVILKQRETYLFQAEVPIYPQSFQFCLPLSKNIMIARIANIPITPYTQ